MSVSLISYWEREQYIAGIDVVIAGSGIVGLHAGLALKRKNPALKILVAERGALPSGASTKNAGFACFGSITELMDDLSHLPEKDVFKLVEKRYIGLKKLRENIGDANMKLEMWGGYEVFDSEEEYRACAEKMDYFNERLKAITGTGPTYVNADEKIASFGFSGVKHMILNRGEGQIDTGQMMSALIEKAKIAGVRLMNGLEILRYEEDEHGLTLFTASGFNIRTRKLIVCTNGFAKQLLPEEDVQPARAQVLVTNEIPNLKFRGTFHYDKGYYYFRNIGNRILFGGGRNLDFAAEQTTAHALTPLVQDKLDELLQRMIIPGTDYSIDLRWAGTMGVGQTKAPIVKQITDHVYCAVRMGGMGVALGSLTGEEVAELVIKEI